MSTIEERVASGVEWLNANYPGWRDRVMINDFSIESTCRCVLGQLFNTEATEIYTDGFGYAINSQILTYAEAGAFGFDIAVGDNWGDLQSEWERVLAGTK